MIVYSHIHKASFTCICSFVLAYCPLTIHHVEYQVVLIFGRLAMVDLSLEKAGLGASAAAPVALGHIQSRVSAKSMTEC